MNVPPTKKNLEAAILERWSGLIDKVDMQSCAPGEVKVFILIGAPQPSYVGCYGSKEAKEGFHCLLGAALAEWAKEHFPLGVLPNFLIEDGEGVCGPSPHL